MLSSQSLTLVIALLLLPSSQLNFESGRAAALQFAMKNGLIVPKDRRAIVLESDFGVRHQSKPRDKSDAEIRREGQALVGVVERSRADNGAKLLRCVTSRSCVPINNESVIVVNDPEVTETGVKVFLSVYFPSDNPKYDGYQTIAVIEVVARGNGWAGEKVLLGPTTVPVKLR